MSPDVFSDGISRGIAQLREEFGALEVTPTGDGGGRVTVARVPLPPMMSLSHSWVGFLLPYNYDEVQVYGHFVPADLHYANGQPLQGPGLQPGQSWEGQPAIKISRNSPRWRSGLDNAVMKLINVVEWLGSRT
jgi:hypothetical protein